MNKTEILCDAFFKELEARVDENLKFQKETGKYVPPIAYFFEPNNGLCSECFLISYLVHPNTFAPLFRKEDYPWTTIDELDPFNNEDDLVVGCYECGEIIAEADKETKRKALLREKYKNGTAGYCFEIDKIMSDKDILLHEAVESHEYFLDCKRSL